MTKTLRTAAVTAFLALCAVVFACGKTPEPPTSHEAGAPAPKLAAAGRVPPYAQLLVSRNGATPTAGPQNLSVNAGDVLTFSAASSVGVTTWLWEIIDYPPGMTLPTGWAWEGVPYASPMMYNLGFAPPAVTVPAQGPNNWGKIFPRLTVNGNPLQYLPSGAQNVGFNPNRTDSSTMLYLASPSGLEGIAFQEQGQGDSYRLWEGTIMRNFRALSAGGGGGLAPSPQVYTANVTLPSYNQQAWANTNGGSFTITFPAPPTGTAGARISTSDTGKSFSNTHWLGINGGSIPILLPANDPISGALQGTLQTVYHQTTQSESLSFTLVPNDPTLGTYWLTVGDGFSQFSAIGAVYTASTPGFFLNLAPITQWVPANTNAGSFTVNLPSGILTLQIMTTDTGKSFSVSKSLTVCAAAGNTILLPANDPVTGFLQGTFQACFHQTVPMSSYAWQLIIGDPTYSTPYWLAN